MECEIEINEKKIYTKVFNIDSGSRNAVNASQSPRRAARNSAAINGDGADEFAEGGEEDEEDDEEEADDEVDDNDETDEDDEEEEEDEGGVNVVDEEDKEDEDRAEVE